MANRGSSLLVGWVTLGTLVGFFIGARVEATSVLEETSFRLRANQVQILDINTGMTRAFLGSRQDGSVGLSFMGNPYRRVSLLDLGLTPDDTPFITIYDKEGGVVAELSVEYGDKTRLTIEVDGKAEVLETDQVTQDPPPDLGQEPAAG